jgi:DNA-binding MarR family transcriptional regulator
MLDKLEREKLIERSGRQGDKRVKVIRVSTRGSQILDNAWPGYMKTMKSVMDKLSLAEQKALAELMFRWYRDLKH